MICQLIMKGGPSSQPLSVVTVVVFVVVVVVRCRAAGAGLAVVRRVASLVRITGIDGIDRVGIFVVRLHELRHFVERVFVLIDFVQVVHPPSELGGNRALWTAFFLLERRLWSLLAFWWRRRPEVPFTARGTAAAFARC